MSPALAARAEALEESDYWHKGERFDPLASQQPCLLSQLILIWVLI